MSKTFEILNFGNWDLFDICYLGFGISNSKYTAIKTGYSQLP